MAINPNNGVLDIINGTLKVSSIDIKQAGGFTTAINTVARNDVLLYDDQHTTTTFTPTQNAGYSSSSGVTRDTTAIDLNDGWVYWPLQLPNSWHAEFDMYVTTTGGVLTYSIFNTSEPNHTDYTANDGGYKIVFDNTNNQIDVYWEGSVHATTPANLRSTDWQHVNINYFQGAVSISLAGKVVLTHKFSENYQEFDSRYVGFSATSGASHKIRHLIVHNSDKWLYTKTSNASDITYVSGNVGIGTLTPTELLDVHGNVHVAKNLTVNGNLTVSGTTTFIDTQNLAIEDPIIEVARGNASDTIDAGLVITRATSNVAVAFRGDEEELAFGYTQSGASGTDVTPIANGGLDVRVYGNLFANNLTTTANVDATYLKGNGSEITHVTLDQVVGYGNVTSNTIQLAGLTATGNVEANYFIGNGSKLTGLVTDLQSVTDNGNVTSNTVQFTNATTAFVADSNVGIGTDTPAANLHVMGYQYVNGPPTLANAFDHSDAPLTLTHDTATSSTAINDPKPLLHLTRSGTNNESYGARASFNLSRYENSSTHSRSRLDVALADGTYAESTVMTLRADGKVGVGTDTPAYTLDVAGDINLSGDFYQGGSPFVSSLWTDGTDSLYYRSNVEVGTANLFVDTTTSNVGIGTTTPGYTLDVRGTANVGALTATSISGPLSGNADTATSLETARTIGGESFDGTANIDLPGVNTVGTQNTSGNAATATALETARTIGGESFDGTANIDLPGVNTAGTQNTSGNADTATTATNQSGGTVSATTGTFSGNVGIGTTSPGGKLDVVASTEGDYIARFKNSSVASDEDARIVIEASDAGGESQILLQTTDESTTHKWNITTGSGITPSLGFQYDSSFNGGTWAMNILHGGNVGIGTTSPNRQLQIYSDSSNYFSFSPAEADDTSIVDNTNFGATSFKKQMMMRLNSRNWYWGIVNDTSNYLGLGADGGVGNDPDIQCVFQNDGTFWTKNIRTSGNVGIGTTNPDLELHVHDANNSTSGIILSSTSGYHRFYEASGQLYFQSGTAASADSRADINFTSMYASTTYMKILGSNGNVGIGTTSPDQKLEVHGNILLGNNDVNSFIHGGGNAVMSADTNILIVADSNDTSGAAPAGDIIFGSGSAVDTNQNRDFTYAQAYPSNVPRNEHMRITGDGNVGIGTTSPSHPLTIQETTTNTNTVTYPLAIRAISSGTVANGFGAGIRFQCERTNTDDYQSLAGSVEVYGAGNLPGTSDLWNMRFGVRYNDTAVTPMTLKYDGNVGIGTTNPGYKLDVAGSFRVNGGYTSTFGNDGLLHINSRSTTHGSETVALQTTIDGRALTAANPGIHGGESRNVLALQPDGGYVGIGTASPATKLHVDGSLLVGDRLPYGSATHTDAQLILGGFHNSSTEYNTSNQIKLLISGADNDGASPYFIMCEDENGGDQFWVKGSESSSGTQAKMFVNGSMKNNNPCFYARRSSGQGTGVYIFNIEQLDSHNAYNPTNGRFTAPIAGRYVFNVWAMSNGATVLYTEFRKNGLRVYNATPYTGNVGSYGNIAGTIVINLAVNDYIDINVLSGAAYGGGNDHNGFCGYMIG